MHNLCYVFVLVFRGGWLEGDSPRVPGMREVLTVLWWPTSLTSLWPPPPRMNTDKLFESHGGQRLSCWLPESSRTEETRQEVRSCPDASRWNKALLVCPSACQPEFPFTVKLNKHMENPLKPAQEQQLSSRCLHMPLPDTLHWYLEGKKNSY